MATTTFSGPVVSTAGFTGDVTGNVTGNITGDVQGGTLTTTAAAGITGGTGTVYSSEITKVGKVITTHIFIDLTGLDSVATDGDIIGTGASAAHLGQITVADNGILMSGSVTCLETPAGGDPNIYFVSADEATGALGDAISGLSNGVTVYDPNGDWSAVTVAAAAAVPTANQYLYAVQGDATGTADTYTAGQFLIELIGYEA